MMHIIFPPNPLELDEGFISNQDSQTRETTNGSHNTSGNNIHGKLFISEITLPIIQNDESQQINVDIEYINIGDNELLVRTKQGNNVTIFMNIESIKFIRKLEAAIREKLETH